MRRRALAALALLAALTMAGAWPGAAPVRAPAAAPGAPHRTPATPDLPPLPLAALRPAPAPDPGRVADLLADPPGTARPEAAPAPDAAEDAAPEAPRLLGLFVSGPAVRALIAAPGEERPRWRQVGDRVGGAEIAAIDRAGVRFADGTPALRLPRRP